MATMKKIVNKFWQNVEKLEPLCTVQGNFKWYFSCGKQYGDSSKMKTELPNDPANPLLGINPKQLKAGS